MTYDTGATTPEIDPDPFTIGLGVFSAMVSGIGFLEMRKQTRRSDESRRQRLRAAWFASRRAVISLRGLLDEFAMYVGDEAFGARTFRVRSVRLVLDRDRARDLRGLYDRTHDVSRELVTSLDALSDHLPPEYQARVDATLTRFEPLSAMPETFGDLIRRGREAVDAYTELLDDIAAREGFEVEVTPIGTARSRREREPPPS